MKSSIVLVGIAALVLLVCVSANTQEPPKNLPTKKQLANDNKLFLTLASKALKWDEPAEAVKIVGPLYFVGTQGLSSWLFTTPEGHILLNTGTPNSGPMIAESIASSDSSLRTSGLSSTVTATPITLAPLRT